VIGADRLTGRDSELGTIRRALSGGSNSGVVIVGAAGVGKTRLAREVLTRAQTSGERTNWIVGTESARPLPLGAFTASIGDAISDPVSDVRRVINSFVAQQGQRRALIGVDDAHLLDGLSAHVVHQLAQSQGVRLVVTMRTGGEEPDAVTALWKDGLLTRLDLEPLSPETTRSLIETTLGGAVDARSAQRLWKLTGGNALFLRQLVTDQVAAGRMRPVAGVWMWDDDCAVSPSIGDMVGRLLGRLTPQLALIVDTLSQCEPLATEVLCDLVSRADLEAAEQMHLVVVERSDGMRLARLAHPLFGEIRRATAGEMYLSRIRGRLAQRLAADADGDMQATVRRALLTLESELPADPRLFLTSARFAMTLLDLDLADRFATAAAQSGAPEAIGVRAMNLVLLGHGEQAEALLHGIKDDAHHWSTVGVDYLKYDWCRADTNDADQVRVFTAMRDALRATGRRIIYSINPTVSVDPAPGSAYDWSAIADMSRNSVDLVPLWHNTNPAPQGFLGVSEQLAAATPLAARSLPGHWNDPDMLVVGISWDQFVAGHPGMLAGLAMPATLTAEQLWRCPQR
jgi:alpha galactosidase A-like protein/AAA ATPase-like protein